MGLKIRKVAVHGNSQQLESYIQEHPRHMHHKDKNGWTVLHEAVRGGRVDSVERLLKHGVDKNLPTNAGQTPLKLARQYLDEGHELVKYLEGIGAEL